MKKISFIIILLLTLFTVFGCKPQEKDEATFVFKNGDVVETLKIDITNQAEDIKVVDILESTEYKDIIKADLEDGTYGKYIVSIYDMPINLAKQYVSLYTTLSDYIDTSYGEEVVINNVKYRYANVGVSELPVIEGAYYMFSVERFANDEATFVFKNGDVVETLVVDITDLGSSLKVVDILTNEKYSATIKAVVEDGAYGKYLVSIFDFQVDPNSQYIALYTTLADYIDTSYGEEVTVNDVKYRYANVGISELPVVDGGHYMFSLETF